MKRFIALLLAVMMTAAVLCACGNSGDVKTSVPSKYDDGFAENYAKSNSTDDNGNKVYEFTKDQYDDYTKKHKSSLDAEVTKEIAIRHPSTGDEATPYGEFVYINDEKKAVIVGVHPEQYDEATAKEEAATAAEYGFKYFQNLKDPVDSIKVLYTDAADQENVLGSFDFTAEK